MRIKTDRGLNPLSNEIKILNRKCKALRLIQKPMRVRLLQQKKKKAFQKLLFKIKDLDKRLKKRIESNKLIQKARNNLNNVESVNIVFCQGR